MFNWDRNIAFVACARFIARLGGEAAFFIGVWGMAAYRFHASATQIALLMAVLALSSMVGAAAAGALVDRFGPRNVIMGAQVFYLPVALLVPFVPSMQVMIGVCALFGFVNAPIMTATGSFAPYLVTEKAGIEKINALLEGVGALSFVAGPAIGSVFAHSFGIASVFYLDAVLTTIGLLLVLPVKTPPLVDREHKHALREIADGLKMAYSLKAVRYYVLMGTVVWFSFGAFSALEPLFYRDVVKTGVETIGWMNSLFGAGIALGAFLLTKLPSKVTSARGLAIGVALLGMGATIYIGTTDLRIIALGAFVWGTVIGAVEPLLRTLMQLDAPEEYVGRIIGTAQLHRSAGELVPLALAPGLAALFGVQGVMIGGGVLAAIAALASFGHAASIDRSGHRPRGRVTAEELPPYDEPLSPLT